MDLSSSRKPPNLQLLVPISKNIRPNQIHSDYSFPIFSKGKIVVSRSMEKIRGSNSSREICTGKNILGGSKENVVQRALEERKIKKSYTSTRIAPELNLFYSKKHRIADFGQYPGRDFRDLSGARDMGGLGSSRIGNTQWDIGKQKFMRTKVYGDILKKRKN